MAADRLLVGQRAKLQLDRASEILEPCRLARRVVKEQNRRVRRGSRYVIPAGTEVLITKSDSAQWFSYRTKKEVSLDRLEQSDGLHFLFRHAGYLIRVHQDDVLGWGTGRRR